MTDVIATAALVSGQRVLLAHRHPRRRWYPDCWDLVGGHVELGESPEQAIARECREEISVEITQMQRVHLDLADPNLVAHSFLVTRWRGEPVNAAPEEHDALAWYGIDDLPGLRLAHPSYEKGLRTLMAKAMSSGVIF